MKTGLFISIALCFSFLSAQQPYFIHYGVEQGLESEYVYDILQDNDGFIWIAHNQGLSSFDGFDFTHYQEESQVSFSGSNLQMDFEGRVWYQTFDGYFYFVENSSLKHFEVESKPIGYFPAAIIDSLLWTIDETGVAVYSITSGKKIRHFYIDLYQLQSTAYDNTRFYLIFNNEIFVFNNNFSYEKLTINNNFPQNYFKYLFPIDNKLFLGFKLNETKQLFEFKDSELIPWLDIEEVSFLQNIYSDNENFWVLTRNGIVAVEKNGEKVIKSHIFKGIPVSKVIKDRQNNHWVSSNGKGIFLIPGIKNTIISELNFTPKIIKDIGNYFIFLDDNGVVYKCDKKLSNFNKWIEDFEGKKIYDVFADNVNNKLALLGSITYFMDLQKGESKEVKVSLKGIEVLDDKFYAVTGTSASGILLIPGKDSVTSIWDSLYNYQKHVSFTENLSVFLPYERGKSLLVNKQKNEIYFGTNIHLYKFTATKKTPILYQQKPIIARMLQQNGNDIYIQTTRQELLKWDGKQVTELHFKNIKGDKRFGNLKIQEGKLFFSHENQLYYYPLNACDSIAIAISMGVNTNIINDLLLLNNKLLILTDKEILNINLKEIESDNFNFNFVVNKVSVNGETIQESEMEKLAHFMNNIEIAYSILNFGSANPEIFYRLNNNVWQKTSRLSRTVSFNALAPGRYTISFKSNKSDEILASINFKVIAPFWKQWWFYGLVALFFIALFGTYYVYRLKVLKSQNKLLREKIALEKSLSDSVLTSIKSQMNPHFFYNALNTIQAYIFKNDKHNASKYLNKFSKLTRTILEMSDKETISTKKEIEALRLYLELEKMRFDNDFFYTINFAKGLDSDFYNIPPMLIQPYVENAIKHGLLHKQGEKKLTISFSIDNQEKYLTIEVDDNGIGREKSAYFNKNKSTLHEPFATKANLKRLEIINRGNPDLVSVFYTDKTDLNYQSKGTTVVIKILLK